MGASGSSLQSKASVVPAAVVLTTLTKAEVEAAYARLDDELGGEFALNEEAVATLLGLDDVSELFAAFDTDEDGLVTAHELLGAVTLAASMARTQDRAKLIFGGFDFNGSGDLTQDEMTILLRAVIVGAAKIDNNLEVPSMPAIEAMTAWSWHWADTDASGSITLQEFLHFCSTFEQVSGFIKYWHGCLRLVPIADGEQWEDPAFPATGSSLYFDEFAPPPGAAPADTMEWLRPSEICEDGSPSLFGSGDGGGSADAWRVYTGAVADEWLKQSLEVAACSDKANITSLFVPTHQEEQGRYCVRLFKQGEWVLVDIDDRLPCDGLGHRVFMKCRDGSVFWASLLEKAAAKLHGCYEALTGGVMREGLEDVTGGVCAAVPMRRFRKKFARLHKIISSRLSSNIIGVIRKPRGRKARRRGDRTLRKLGIPQHQAYAVLETANADGEIAFKLRSTTSKVYKGALAAGSSYWEAHPDLAAACNYDPEASNADGFWMPAKEFTKTFTQLIMNRRLQHSEGWLPHEWTAETAGGSVRQPSWRLNPQFHLTLTDDTPLVIVLHQAEPRLEGNKWNAYPNTIGTLLAKHEWGEADAVRPMAHLHNEDVVKLTRRFQRTRSVALHTRPVPAGQYTLLPMTWEAGQQGSFTLTVYARKPCEVVGGAEEKVDEAAAEEAAAAEDDDDEKNNPVEVTDDMSESESESESEGEEEEEAGGGAGGGAGAGADESDDDANSGSGGGADDVDAEKAAAQAAEDAALAMLQREVKVLHDTAMALQRRKEELETRVTVLEEARGGGGLQGAAAPVEEDGGALEGGAAAATAEEGGEEEEEQAAEEEDEEVEQMPEG